MVYFAQRKNGLSLWFLGIFWSLNQLRPLTDSDHLTCDPSNPAGCQHCIICPPVICCELCNPKHFKDFAQSDPSIRPKRPRNQSHIGDYQADQYDMNLRDALNKFCEQETIKRFGKSRLKNSGPGLIMPNDILSRIVDCVHAQNITSKEDLHFETHWSRVDLLADAVLAIIDICRRPSIILVATNEGLPAMDANVKKVPKVGKSRCGACGEVGHNSVYPILLSFYNLTFFTAESNTRCPKYPSKGKENVPPPPAAPSATSSSITHQVPNVSPSGPFQFCAPYPAFIPPRSVTLLETSIHPNIFYDSRT
jgi:hypothetical protein